MQSSVVEQLLPPTSRSSLPPPTPSLLPPSLLRDPLLERGLDFLIFNWEKNVAEVVDEIPPSPSLNFDDVPPPPLPLLFLSPSLDSLLPRRGGPFYGLYIDYSFDGI